MESKEGNIFHWKIHVTTDNTANLFLAINPCLVFAPKNLYKNIILNLCLVTAVLKRLSYCPRSAASLVYLLYSVHVVLFYCSKYTLGCCQPGLFYTWIRYRIQSSYLVPCHLFSFSVACLISCPVASFCLLFSLTELFPFLSPVLSPFLLPVLSPLLLHVLSHFLLPVLFLLFCLLSYCLSCLLYCCRYFFFLVTCPSFSLLLSIFLLPVTCLPSCCLFFFFTFVLLASFLLPVLSPQ